MGAVNTDGSIRRMLPFDPGRQLASDHSAYVGAFARPTNTGDRLLAIAILPGESLVGWFDTHTGELVAGPMTIRALSGEPTSPCCSRTARRSWATDDQGASKHSVDLEQWVEIACGIVHRELTVDEWHRYVDPASDPIPACP